MTTRTQTESHFAIPLAVPNMSQLEADYLLECISSNFVSSVGPFVLRFEDLCASLSGFPYAVATNTGTSALHVALTALGVRGGDLVVMPSYTFIGTANAVRACGADPWLLDVEYETWGLNPELLEYELERNTLTKGGELWHRQLDRRVSAVIAVCAVGHPPRLHEAEDVAHSRGIPLLVDAAGAAGVEYLGQKLGSSVSHAILSFNGNKTLTAGGGGAVLTQDHAIADRVRHLSTTARTGEDYVHDATAFNYRQTNIQAAVGCAQLERAQELIERKRAIDQGYRAAWRETDFGLEPFPRAEWASSTCWMTGALLPVDWADGVPLSVSHLARQGIQARSFWKPMHLQTPYLDCPRSEMEVTNSLWSRVLTLPSSTSLKVDEQQQVIQAVFEGVTRP